MDIIKIIHQKRDGGELTSEQIKWVIESYSTDKIPDYQMAALGMAIFLNGMSNLETIYLTEHMLDSGISLQWQQGNPVVDKHSTGGIGDKISIILAPLLASCDFRVPMISGRGLGPTGGTLDKLESVSGFRTDLTEKELQDIVHTVGCVITGTTPQIAPADRKIYALRDVTGIVASVPLITASILSKKLAENLDALVLDVKCGSGSFMQSIDDARHLARSLCSVGKHFGLQTTALITDMNQPLGKMIGNKVEVDESIQVLKGSGPYDVRELTLNLGTELLVNCRNDTTHDEAREQLIGCLDSGKAYDCFVNMVHAQGGRLPLPKIKNNFHELVSSTSGRISQTDCRRFGEAIIALGGGRKQLHEKIDHTVGIEILVRLGDYVEKNQPWCRILYKTKETLHRAKEILTNTLVIDTEESATRHVSLVTERYTSFEEP